MPQPVAILNIVALSPSLLEHAPRLRAFAAGGTCRRLIPSLPAVTCTVQSSMLTGRPVSGHGIVANGWYDRESAEIRFWKQSNRLVQGEKIWDIARRRDASVTTAQMFWWFNMYADVDWAVTPRPMYKADGRKLPDVHAAPGELRDWLQAELGPFPLFRFWGPAADLVSTRWIADATRLVVRRHDPTLTFAYLPHLDYALQKDGPEAATIPARVREIDDVAGDLIDDLEACGRRVIVLSEYGIEPVTGHVPVNRVLREAGLLEVRAEQGLELLDPGASRAFAVADHQVAHVYLDHGADPAAVARLLQDTPGVERVLDRAAQAEARIEHPRSGDLVAVAERGRWMSYAYWLDDARAPDFARTVDIHRKPGYDPLELFLDPALKAPKLAIAWRLLRRKLGFRTLMDVIPLNADLVRGAHGRVETAPDRSPVLMARGARDWPEELPCEAVRDVVLAELFGAGWEPTGLPGSA